MTAGRASILRIEFRKLPRIGQDCLFMYLNYSQGSHQVTERHWFSADTDAFHAAASQRRTATDKCNSIRLGTTC